MQKERNRVPFTNFGADVKEARNALGYTQKAFAEEIGIGLRYLANIENSGALPSLPIFYELIKRCSIPVERYFHPEALQKIESKERAKTVLKLNLCPEKYLPIVESTLDAVLEIDREENK
jgi:transcriptional regulator with XRE-family HTH domain